MATRQIKNSDLMQHCQCALGAIESARAGLRERSRARRQERRDFWRRVFPWVNDKVDEPEYHSSDGYMRYAEEGVRALLDLAVIEGGSDLTTVTERESCLLSSCFKDAPDSWRPLPPPK